jgi:transaldolase
MYSMALLLLLQIKLPCTPDGLAVASALMARDESISITITGMSSTCCFSLLFQSAAV